ncbi:chromate transporter [Brevibacillus ginsengisoli]|uniref:chromate transporter n=1 Tax=Brevibacillus ginsengisoli TaxID=363854 RepID=UPI003CEBFE32
MKNESTEVTGENRTDCTSLFRRLLEVLWVSTKLGVTSFGGPIAHLGFFHDEYIKRRRWLDERTYADLVALCQFLPGPASSQVGMGIGIMRAGLWGGVFAWIGFTLPSVIALTIFALFLKESHVADSGWIHGLKIVAVAIVAQAVWGMASKLTPDRNRATMAVIVMGITLLWQTAISQIALIIVAGIMGLFLYRGTQQAELPELNISIRRSVAVISLVAFFALLVLLPVMRMLTSSQWLAVFDSFYRSGSLVFGGGHVVLPLLEREVVPVGWLTKEQFLAGYGAAQAVPGPLFTFAGYLGAMMGGWSGALIATIAIFLPAFLLVVGTLPFWDSLRKRPKFQGALTGVNTAVVGILLATLYNPIWTSSIYGSKDFVLAAVLFSLLVFWRTPPWAVVLAGAVGGFVIL